MKKSLLALAVMGAFAGAAHAQSAVTVYGSFDGGVRHIDNVNAAGDSRTTMGSVGTYNNNRIGFRGVEDLGGGLNARFVLEAGFNTGTGALDSNATLTATTGGVQRLFQRTASVGLGGAWGGVDFGRQYSVAFKTIGGYEPFGYKYTGIIPLALAAAGSTGNATFATSPNTTAAGAALAAYSIPGGARFDNDIQYTGNFGPVTVRAEYALGEQTGSTGDNTAVAVGGSFASGPFSVGAAYTQKKNNVGAILTGLGAPAGTISWEDQNQWTVGGAYKIGAVRVSAGYMQDKQDLGIAGADDMKIRNTWAGVNYAVSPAVELTAALYQTKRELAVTEGKRNLFMLGATYALSKRTNFYGAIDHSRLKDDFELRNAAGDVEDRVTGISVGINHLF
ncbi:porin [Noviherbaspirillum agri]